MLYLKAIIIYNKCTFYSTYRIFFNTDENEKRKKYMKKSILYNQKSDYARLFQPWSIF